MYNSDEIREYYNKYGEKEWHRLEQSIHGQVQFQVTTHIIKKYLKKDAYVLDAGAGPGRYSIWLAQHGAKVYLSDISDEQLKIAEDRVTEAGVNERVQHIRRHDICDLNEIPDNTFDLVPCLGGALSYVREGRHQAIQELIRVAKLSAPIITSVMSLLGTFHLISSLDGVEFLEGITDHIDWDPETSFPEVMDSILGSNEWHAPMTLYTSTYMRKFLEENGCKVVEVASPNTITSGVFNLEKIEKSPDAFEMLLNLEKKFCNKPGIVDMGQHLLTVAIKL